MPAYAIVNLHASYMFDEHTSLALGVYNMFNTLAFTEADNGYAVSDARKLTFAPACNR